MDLSPEDFGGEHLAGCNEVLVATKPDAIDRLHRSFLEVGCDVVETDTFGSFSIVLAEYGLEHRATELSRTATDIARRAADAYSTPGKPRFVAGSIGPGTKFPTLGQIPYADLRASYVDQARAILEGGADLFIIETMFDLLGAKAAINACRLAMAEVGRRIPLQVQVTIELTGRMLPGTEIGAALTALEALSLIHI